MLKPKCIHVKYVRIAKDKSLTDQSIGFAYSPEFSLEDNVSAAVGFVEAVHDVKSVLLVVLEF